MEQPLPPLVPPLLLRLLLLLVLLVLLVLPLLLALLVLLVLHFWLLQQLSQPHISPQRMLPPPLLGICFLM
jgi:hypothetical protein